MPHDYGGIIWSVIRPRLAAAERLGVSADELWSVGRLAAFQASESWEPEGGRSLESWIWLNVNWDVGRELRRQAVCFAEELGEDEPMEEDDLDTLVLVRQALGYLRAELSSPEWTLLWLLHAEGRSCNEIAQDLGISRDACKQRICRARTKAVTVLRARGIAEIGATLWLTDPGSRTQIPQAC